MERDPYGEESEDLFEEKESLEQGTAIYGETDMDPNREDQESAHHAEADEHL